MSFPLLFAPACVLISPYIRYEMEEPQPRSVGSGTKTFYLKRERLNLNQRVRSSVYVAACTWSVGFHGNDVPVAPPPTRHPRGHRGRPTHPSPLDCKTYRTRSSLRRDDRRALDARATTEPSLCRRYGRSPRQPCHASTRPREALRRRGRSYHRVRRLPASGQDARRQSPSRQSPAPA